MSRDELKGKQTPGKLFAPEQHTAHVPGTTASGNGDWCTWMNHRDDDRGLLFCPFTSHGPSITESQANAALYAEAHNVANETGMWPLDLVERIKGLEEQVKSLSDWAMIDHVELQYQQRLRASCEEALEQCDARIKELEEALHSLYVKVGGDIIVKMIAADEIDNARTILNRKP